MQRDLISKKTRNEFRQHFVGYTLAEIREEFDAGDVSVDLSYEPPESGQRRCLVEQYYHTVDWKSWRDVRKVLTVYANVLATLENQVKEQSDIPFGGRSSAGQTFNDLKKWIERDGFVYADGRLEPSNRDFSLSGLEQHNAVLDAPTLQAQIKRLRESVEDDPDLAIGTAKEMIETTCKMILGDCGVTVESGWDIPRLVKETRQVLKLMPDSVPDSAKGADVVKRVLSNLGTVAQGITELRNLYGTGHGKHGRSTGLKPRHARLACGAASALVSFLFETHQERKEGAF